VSGSFTITPRGPFSLAEAATFGFGQRAGGAWDGVMRLAFCLDGYRRHAGVELRQDAEGVHGTVHGPVDLDLRAVRRQVARVLSLDHDGAEFSQVGARDPVIGALQAAAPGLRPPLFYSPYEAAAWAVLSSRRPAKPMMAVRDRLSQEHGAVFELAGQRLAALPTPGQLIRLESFPGIAPERMVRLRGVAQAALEGLLDVTYLKELGPDHAIAQLQAIGGIGPFYSALIVIRGTGFTDVLPVGEPRLLALVARLYGLPAQPGPAKLHELAEVWRPFRTWTSVLIRAAARRVTRRCARRGVPQPGRRWLTRAIPQPRCLGLRRMAHADMTVAVAPRLWGRPLTRAGSATPPSPTDSSLGHDRCRGAWCLVRQRWSGVRCRYG